MKKNIYVVGAVILKDNKILCAQRSRKMSLPLLWEFPGGKIEAGETPENALIREILEEMNCAIKIEKQVEHTIHEYDFGIVHLTTFLCHIIKGSPLLLEHEKIEWLSVEQLHTLPWAPADIPTVNTLQKNKRS